ncbi:MAG: zinc ribbon domain-containing protein [Planctomycetota bacterium]
MARRISSERKFAYYFGAALSVVGFLVFLSGGFEVVSHMSTGPSFGDQPDPAKVFTRAIIGMVLFVGGGFVRSIGARGLAGSGVVLDPERARGELEPYSRMSGGMLKDGLDEAGVDIGDVARNLGGSERRGGPVVMIKCRACGKLNEEDSKFCQECGEKL